MFNTDDITILFAAAGAGKTTHLIKCIDKDLEKYRPEDLAFVSYTRKGAYEGKDRIIRKNNIDPERLAYFRTLHSLAYGELGYKHSQIFEIRHARKLNSSLGFNLTTSPYSESNTQDDKLLSLYEARRAGLNDPYAELDGHDHVRYQRFVNAYESFKKLHGLVDYTDCLVNFVKRGKPVPVKVAYIDEAQDLTTLQWEVCKVAFAKAEKIYIAGDDFQSIFTFAGARPDILIDMASKHKTVKLEVSYRLPKKVYAFARAITDIISQKVEKDYAPFKDEEGKVEFIHDRSLFAKLVENKKDETWLLLFRNNYSTGSFEKELQHLLVPYHTARGFVIGEKRMTRIKKFYNFRKEGFGSKIEKEAFASAYNVTNFKQELCDTDIIESNDKYWVQAYIDKYGVEELTRMAKEKPKVFVSTVHRVKGAEAKNVAMFMDCSFKVHRNRYRDFDSELRILYVALTRAKQNLYIVRSQSKYGLDDIIDVLKEYNEL